MTSGSPMTVGFYATKRCVNVSFVMYTGAYRKILTYKKQGPFNAGENTITIPGSAFVSMSAGVYYGQVTAEGEAGEKERGKAVVVVIVR